MIRDFTVPSGNPEALGDLLVRQLLQVAKDDGRAQRRGQRFERLPQHGAQVLVLRDGVRPAIAGGRLQLAGVDVARDRLALLPHAAVVIDAEIPADADDPGLKVRAAIERGERLEDLQEDILREIFGLVVLADELVGDVEDLAPVLPDDRLPRDLVAAQALLDQAVRRVAGCAAAESADMRLYRDILHAFVPDAPAEPSRSDQDRQIEP